MTKPRVFIVNEPLNRGGSRAIDVRPAREFGEITFVFPPGQPPLDPRHIQEHAAEALADFGPGDYLIPVGHVACIAAASAVAARRAGGVLNVLIWDNRDYIYTPIRLVLWEDRQATASPSPEELENQDG